MSVLEIIGLFSILLITILILMLLISIVVGVYLIRRNKLIFPKIFIYIADNFYSILLKLFLLIGTEETFYNVGTEFYNKYYEEQFKKSKNKVLILPHCLRDAKCPAKLTPNGVECVFCGRCCIGEIIKTAKENGYKVFIVPGSTFLKRILRDVKPDGVFGVACSRDLFYGMNYLSRKGIPAQGQALIKDGCINTMVDVNELLQRLRDSNVDNKNNKTKE
ncbi:protein of unknown function DUF116 [Methanotorris formicicus Mc-S-70]|uniref:Polyprenyl synthetase n=2 Tax=Methanotorris formicicus TaxID=213185 RepID=H1KX44_9EURY|nr:protein of unknown function DUF116 [Methanotorris formicicus Mc-S-70]